MRAGAQLWGHDRCHTLGSRSRSRHVEHVESAPPRLTRPVLTRYEALTIALLLGLPLALEDTSGSSDNASPPDHVYAADDAPIT